MSSFAIAMAMACIFLLSSANAIRTSNNAFFTSAFHQRSPQCAFMATATSKQRQPRSQRRATRTQLAANGGMDAYDAQMAAMTASRDAYEAQMASINQPTATDEPTAIDESSMPASKWTGQNSYTQQLLQEQPAAASVGTDYSNSYSQYSPSNIDQSFAEEQSYSYSDDEATYAAAESAIDPYEMQFTNYLLSLQHELETASNEMNDYSPPMEAMNEQQPQPHSPSLEETTPSIIEQLDEEDMGDKFLKMVSNEVEYKKLLNQSPYAVTDIEWRVLIQRFLDNTEDSTQKKNGKFKGESKLNRKLVPKKERKTVVLLGTGWASHSFVKLASTYDLRVVVVSPVNHFVFTPMLASAAVGTVEYRSMTEPIRVTNPYIDNYVEGRAIGVDVEGKKIQVQLTSLSTVTGAFKGIATDAPCRLDPEPVQTSIVYSDDGAITRDKSMGAGDVIELSYDHLICSVGTSSRSSIVPGAKEYCFNLKTSQDSKRLRTAIGEALEFAARPDVQEFYYPDEETKFQAREERQRRLRIAVVGGGPTGVELSGELCDFFAQMCRSPDGAYQRLRDDIEILLIHGGSDLLPSMDTELRERALAALQSQGVSVILNTRLKEVGQDFIRIGEKGTDVVQTIPLAITIWAAGNAPVPFVKELLSQLPESAAGSGGRISVDQWCRCPTPSADSFGSIFALGDIACFEAQKKYETSPEALPQTAQVAGQQGAFVARMLNRGYDMELTPPKLPELSESEAFSLLRVWLIARGLEEAPGFNFLSLGLLAYCGQEEALNQVMVGDVPLFNYSGKLAFVLWRSVYLAKQASSRNQALIAFDWLRTETFGRDITRL